MGIRAKAQSNLEHIGKLLRDTHDFFTNRRKIRGKFAQCQLAIDVHQKRRHSSAVNKHRGIPWRINYSRTGPGSLATLTYPVLLY